MGGGTHPSFPPSSLPTPSKQAHGPVACTSKKMGLARPSTLGSSAAAAAAKVPRALSSASIAMDPWSLDACLNWWRRWAGHCRRPCPGTHCKPPSPRVPADPSTSPGAHGGIPVWCSPSGHLSHHRARAAVTQLWNTRRDVFSTTLCDCRSVDASVWSLNWRWAKASKRARGQL